MAARTAVCQDILPSALREFRESFPQFTVRIDPIPTRAAMHALTEGKANIGIYGQPVRHPGLAFTELFEDEMCFMVIPLHPRVLKRGANRTEIATQRFVLPKPGNESRAYVESCPCRKLFLKGRDHDPARHRGRQRRRDQGFRPVQSRGRIFTKVDCGKGNF